MTQKILPQTVTQHNRPSVIPHRHLITGLRILALAIVLVLAISSAQTIEAAMRSNPMPATFESPDPDSFDYYTERYWNMAAEHEAVTTIPTEEYVTFTDRYWQLARVPATQIPDYTYYAERYWDMAAERELEVISPESYATYTDRYWARAADHEQTSETAEGFASHADSQ